MKKTEITKTRAQILNQDYLSAQDLKMLIPNLGEGRCRDIIKATIEDMKQDGCYIPNGRTYIALTRYIKKKLGIREKI